MIEAGNTIEGMEGRCKPWFRSRSGDGDDYYKLFDIPLRKLIRKAGEKAQAALLPNEQQATVAIWIRIRHNRRFPAKIDIKNYFY